ncbi:uncharacterized protein LOC128852129 [Cuculus canorus]|uniref:uncharacterized protein LOC128852129 n=1 Tax=Cuculus canorus TaxID=55661 RepID=UPI0023AB2360|nr:uncharacterized protein LOC128852129 [Cuculus canorus]
MERRRGLGADEGDGAGLNGLILLLLSARGETAEEGSSPGRSLARSLQKAEAALRSCVRPGLRRLLPPRPRQRRDTDSDTDGDTDGEEEEEEAAEGASLVPALEQSFPGLRHALSIREDPHTETFHGHVRPQPGNTGDAFSYHAAHPCVAQRGAALHALLRHRHLLRLVRAYSCRLHAASAFLRRLLALTDPPTAAVPPLHALCRELRAHTRHWSVLRRRLRGNPWLRPLLLHRHEAVAGMRRALLLLALHAVRLAERHAEKRLRVLARDFCTVAPAPLADLFQGLELYNQAVAELEPELRGAGIADGCRAFPVSRVLAVLAAERGRAAAERLGPLLQLQDAGTERECWDDIAVPWPPEHGNAEGSGTAEAAGIAAELRALCREDEELLGLILHVPGAGWTSAPGSDALLAQYRPQFWGTAGTALEQRLAPPHAGAAGSAARGLARALAHGEGGRGGGGDPNSAVGL